MSKEAKEFFQKNSYAVVKGILDYNTSNLLYNYVIEQNKRSNYKYIHDVGLYDKDWDGYWSDPQAHGSFSKYGDPMFDLILDALCPQISAISGIDLEPNYTYFRLYGSGDVLDRHKDRESCEISITMCLGYNVTNVDKSVYPNYNWPMWVQDKHGNELPVSLEPGDIILYRGCDLDHWRDEFLGLNHAQVFLHYNDKNGPYANKWDGRDQLSIPKKFQTRRKLDES